MRIRFHPCIIDTLNSGYNATRLAGDLSAGITVGVLALPLAMAFAIASGMSPAAGIWTSIVGGFLVSLLGGSRVQIGGPTGAFIPIIYAIVADLGIGSLLIASMMSGVLLFLMGAARLGNMIRFIPLSVVIGFTNGIAIVIFLSQLRDFFGLQLSDLPGEFFARITMLIQGAKSFHPITTALAAGSLIGLLLWNHYSLKIIWMRRIPSPLAILVLATIINAIFQLPVDTIGSRFGGIPQGLPEIHLPTIEPGILGELITPAITIALLGAIESLLSARVADSQINARHDPNQELMAQGVANFIVPLVGGFAATGAIARTATNIRAGGRTPVAGITHALLLLLIVLIAAPLAAAIPLATLSAIVVLVSINMGNWKAFSFTELRRYSMQYRSTLLTTFLLTVIFNLTLAVEIGLVMASLSYLFRMSDLTHIEPIDLRHNYEAAHLTRSDGSNRIVAYRLFGSLFFGAANKLDSLLMMQHGKPDWLILDMNKVIHIDSTGVDILRNVQQQLSFQGTRLALCDLNSQPASLLFRTGFLDLIGPENLSANLEEAIIRSQQEKHSDTETNSPIETPNNEHN